MDPKIILHPTDGSPGAMKALDLACDLARDRTARLIVLHAQRRNGWAAVPADLQGYRRVEHVDISEAEMMKVQSRAILDAAERTARGRGLSRRRGADPGRRPEPGDRRDGAGQGGRHDRHGQPRTR